MKVRGVLYIPTKEYNYKVITECDAMLQGYYITKGRKIRITIRYIVQKELMTYNKESRKPSRRGWKKELRIVY